MPPTPIRRFTIADMMILVVASAAAMVILRPYMPGHFIALGWIPSISTDRWHLLRAWAWLDGPGSCVVVPWMAALIAIRLRRPRPSRLRLAGQPGFVACVAVLVSLAPGLAWYAATRHRPGFQQTVGFQQAWSEILHWSSTAVVGSWIALALTRRWRPEPSWVDRMGRALGAYWVVLLVSLMAILLLEKFLNLLSRWGMS